MDIRPANACPRDPDQRLVRTGLWPGNLSELEPAGLDQNGGVHRRHFTTRSFERSMVEAIATIRMIPNTICCFVASTSK